METQEEKERLVESEASRIGLDSYKIGYHEHKMCRKAPGDGGQNRENGKIEAVRLCFCIQLLEKMFGYFSNLLCFCNPAQIFHLANNCSPKPCLRKKRNSTIK